MFTFQYWIGFCEFFSVSILYPLTTFIRFCVCTVQNIILDGNSVDGSIVKKHHSIQSALGGKNQFFLFEDWCWMNVKLEKMVTASVSSGIVISVRGEGVVRSWVSKWCGTLWLDQMFVCHSYRILIFSLFLHEMIIVFKVFTLVQIST